MPNNTKWLENLVFVIYVCPFWFFHFLPSTKSFQTPFGHPFWLVFFLKWYERYLHLTQQENVLNPIRCKIRIRILYFLIRLLSRPQYICSYFLIYREKLSHIHMFFVHLIIKTNPFRLNHLKILIQFLPKRKLFFSTAILHYYLQIFYRFLLFGVKF